LSAAATSLNPAVSMSFRRRNLARIERQPDAEKHRER
jgi:hypothetical protein